MHLVLMKIIIIKKHEEAKTQQTVLITGETILMCFVIFWLKCYFLCSAHLAASEGHLPCLKFIVCAGASIDHTLNARNDQVRKLQNPFFILFSLHYIYVSVFLICIMSFLSSVSFRVTHLKIFASNSTKRIVLIT